MPVDRFQADRDFSRAEERYLEPPDDEEDAEEQDEDDFEEPDEPDADQEIDDYNADHGTDY